MRVLKRVRIRTRIILRVVSGACCFAAALLAGHVQATESFHAGVRAIDISPPSFPVRVNGMFTERSTDTVVDPLYARALALNDGHTTLVFCVVDTCMMEESLIDAAKSLAAKQIDVPTRHMMVSATHTHSAPSAMACLGSRQDPGYAAWLPGKIAEAIEGAVADLQPAQIAWGAVDDWAHTHNRRWIRRADKTFADPFGDMTVRAHMHPGYESADVIGPSGPVDPGLSLLAVRKPDGTPLGLLANYSQHYYGSPLLSADYYGAFARHMAARLGQSGSEGPFVAMMSQGTSGDLMWMDYGSPQVTGTFDSYAEAVSVRALEAYADFTWQTHVPLGMVERSLTLDYRVPDASRLAWAQERVAALQGAIPMTQADIYAHEAVILHERQETSLKLQAIRIGDLTISTLPDEVYAITGLKLKLQAPLLTHFNIELANGSVGYIPPPEQHELGGYTTWPARTAGLEVQAEPTIVESLLGALEEVSGAPRKAIRDLDSPYATAVTALAPLTYWRLNEIAGRTVHNAVDNGANGTLHGGAALFLPGVGSGSGIGKEAALAPSNFGGPNSAINRAVHFVADGSLDAPVPGLDTAYTVAFWFWLGEESGASARRGTLLRLPTGDALQYAMDPRGLSTLSLGPVDSPASGSAGKTEVPLGQWHFAVLAVSEDHSRLFLNGSSVAEVSQGRSGGSGGDSLHFAEGLEGKLDEIAVFHGILSPENINALWHSSGMAAQQAAATEKRAQATQAARERAKPPEFPPSFHDAVAALAPTQQSSLSALDGGFETEGGVRLTPETYAALHAGRIVGAGHALGAAYSVSLWFKNTLANDGRSVTAYLFSRGPGGDPTAAGDHLGLGGTHQGMSGRLLLFNGNDAGETVVGNTVIPEETWNHVVLVREGAHVTVYLNGESVPEIDADITPSTGPNDGYYLGARSDNFAPLAGFLAEFALFNRPLSPAEALALHTASGQPVGTATEKGMGPKAELSSLPLSPAEGRDTIQVPEGFTVDLVASEPTLLDPVAFDWDTQGRLWVVEMADYPLGLDGDGASGGRVRMLTDRDQNGTYETSALFAEGLNFPTGILTWRDGVIVTAAPDILFLRDSTGDGTADVREVLLTGLSEGNQQLRANGLRWGLDNWVYVAAGGHHGKYALETTLLSSRNATETVIGSRDFRFRPDTGVVEPQSGPTQFGRNRDDWGHWFGTQNARPLWHYALPDHYLKRNPYLAAPDGQVQVLGEVGPPVYPASALEKRFHDFKASGRFTSACSGMIYRDSLLFPDGESNGFTCEPFHNLVQRIALEADGVSFRGTRAAAPDAPDFFASSDRWCRPVMVRTGPDGALWIADMYRYMIEHPQWLPEEGKAELLPFYREGDDRGRIYRVRPTDSPVQAIGNLERMAAHDLVHALASSNGWIRDKAQQLLLWRGGDGAVGALKSLATESTYAQARLHALCTLDGLGALDEATLLAGLRDSHPGVRENALRLTETVDSPTITTEMLTRVSDPDARVRQQLAFSLGSQAATPEVADALADILLADHRDGFITAAALSSALPHQDLLIATLVQRDDPALPPLRLTLLDMSLSAENLDAVATLIAPAFEKATADLSLENAASSAEILSLLGRRDTSVAALSTDVTTGPRVALNRAFLALVHEARARFSDGEQGIEARVAAATLLARVPEDAEGVVRYLARHLATDAAPEWLQRALAIMATMEDPRIPELLIGAWESFTPPAREQTADVLLSRKGWTVALLDAIESRRIRPTDLSPVRRTQLLKQPDESLRARAETLFVLGENPERAEIIAAYAPALSLPGIPEHGKQLYAESCSPCHKLGDVGFEIGPDLRTVAQHPKEKLLANIIDPNLDIQPGYHAYNCELEDGEQLFGLIVSENATSITMKLAGAQLRDILRSDIFALESTTISMMPEGWEATMKHQDIADLIAFLQGLS